MSDYSKGIFKNPPDPFASGEHNDPNNTAPKQTGDEVWRAMTPEQQMKALKSAAIAMLSKSDPFVRDQIKSAQSDDAEIDYLNPHWKSPVAYDDQGNLLPPTRSVLTGSGRDTREYMKAVRENVKKKLGVTDG